MLFVRTLNQVSAYTYQGKRWKWWKEERPPSKSIITLQVTIDPVQEDVRNGGNRPTAALIARLVGAISGYGFAISSKISIVTHLTAIL